MAKISWTLCATCGVENDTGEQVCAICDDERQWVPAGGQRWSTLADRASDGCRIEITEREPGCWALHADPKVDIGQTALLVRTEAGNLLWDVPGFIDDDAVSRVRELGGVAAVLASHPHMYGCQLEWARAFGAPVYVAEADRSWVRRWGEPGEIVTWSAPFDVLPGIRALQPGGHFPGSTVAVWEAGAEGRGVLLSGDTCGAVPDQGWVTFMRSYPNSIPLSAAVVTRVAGTIAELDFGRLYDNFGRQVPSDARAAVLRSAERYAAWVRGDYDHLT
ncbi:MBL fold metallo-hydrolase [Ornithinimicrobium sufpigmenti]|uniref:MBL fold metallo-hydrolase n=1 Tax=Ornithinimicrobium sufpigmenti TaxID=2508882 RepID=UPI00103590C6|nr:MULTISPECIES: MBL fold metallo-hydrolase [unclassified Ornithinimicrobium]